MAKRGGFPGMNGFGGMNINNLMKEAKNLSSDKKNANNGKGISVGYVNSGEVTEYQVVRLYK